MNSLIVNVALTGIVHNKEQHPDLPVTPAEIATDARRCVDAGATILHVHARNDNGNPTIDWGRWKETLDALKAAVPTTVLCCSTSGRRFQSFEDRTVALRMPGWEMASLSVGSYNVGRDASITDPAMVAILDKSIRDRGLLPEMEIFDLSHAFYRGRGWRNLFVGTSLLPCDARHLYQLSTLVPLPWAGAGFGRHQFMVNRWAIILGGHVRIGMEDNTELSNPRQVERIVEFARAIGREPATISETRLELFGC